MKKQINMSEYANFIWEVADLLRGDNKQSDYGKVILPLTKITLRGITPTKTPDFVRDSMW